MGRAMIIVRNVPATAKTAVSGKREKKTFQVRVEPPEIPGRRL
jgi:hypothetical protein